MPKHDIEMGAEEFLGHTLPGDLRLFVRVGIQQLGRREHLYGHFAICFLREEGPCKLTQRDARRSESESVSH